MNETIKDLKERTTQQIRLKQTQLSSWINSLEDAIEIAPSCDLKEMKDALEDMRLEHEEIENDLYTVMNNKIWEIQQENHARIMEVIRSRR